MMNFCFGPCFRVSGVRPRDYTLKIQPFPNPLISTVIRPYLVASPRLLASTVARDRADHVSYAPSSADVEVYEQLNGRKSCTAWHC